MKFLNNKKGMAIIIVLGAITILTALLVEFTFNTEINKLMTLKATQRSQARLNAESALQLAILRISIYAEALNLLGKNEQIKAAVKMEELAEIYSFPFIYPIPIPKKDLDLPARELISNFEKNMLLEGEMGLSTRSISHLININHLRISKNDPNSSLEVKGTTENKNSFDKKIIELIESKLKAEEESNEDFDLLYGSDTAELHMERIKYYISDENSYDSNYKTSVAVEYKDSLPKYAPLTSLSELYLIPELPNAIIKLLSSSLTTFGAKNVDLNTITEEQLFWIFPELDKEETKKYFSKKNSKTRPLHFSNIKEFTQLLASSTNALDESSITKRIEEFKEANVSFDVNPLLFEVVSTGKYNDTTINLKAIIEIPQEIIPPKISPLDQATQDCPEGFELNPTSQGPQEACRESPKKDKAGNLIPPEINYKSPRVLQVTID